MRISADQLQELSPEQQDKLREWWKPEIGDPFIPNDLDISIKYVVDVDKEGYVYDGRDWHPKRYCLPILSIGQCLDVLQSEDPALSINRKSGVFHDDLNTLGWEVELRYHGTWKVAIELINALWKSVKVAL